MDDSEESIERLGGLEAAAVHQLVGQAAILDSLFTHFIRQFQRELPGWVPRFSLTCDAGGVSAHVSLTEVHDVHGTLSEADAAGPSLALAFARLLAQPSDRQGVPLSQQLASLVAMYGEVEEEVGAIAIADIATQTGDDEALDWVRTAWETEYVGDGRITDPLRKVTGAAVHPQQVNYDYEEPAPRTEKFDY